MTTGTGFPGCHPSSNSESSSGRRNFRARDQGSLIVMVSNVGVAGKQSCWLFRHRTIESKGAGVATCYAKVMRARPSVQPGFAFARQSARLSESRIKPQWDWPPPASALHCDWRSDSRMNPHCDGSLPAVPWQYARRSGSRMKPHWVTSSAAAGRATKSSASIL